MEKELGIELTKKFTKDVILLIKEGMKAYKDDKKISTGEWVGMIDDFIPVISNLANASKILDEIKDINTKEGKELILYAISLGVVSEKASLVVSLVVEYLEYQIEGYKKYVVPVVKSFKKDS